jgi:SAM-dependent methyltransferase
MIPVVLPELEGRFHRLKEGRFARALDVEVDSLLARGATPAWYREGLARIRGREASFLRDVVLPGVGPSLRDKLVHELTHGDDRTLALVLAALHAMPTHRPFFIAAEIVKADAAVERRVLDDAIAFLSPRGFYAAHLPHDEAARLAAVAPDAFRTASSMSDVVSMVRALEFVARAAGASVEHAWREHLALVEDPAAFDYGCGAGALMDTFAPEFHVEGGDLFEGRPCDVLHPVLAVLRLVRSPDDALDENGRIASPRVMRLDSCPAASSPPTRRQYSVVTSIGVMEHVMDDAAFEAVLRKTFSLVRPGGVLLLNANPTLVGHDGHHALNPWLGVVLHRWPWLTRQRPFVGRWREGFCRRVSLRSLLAPLREEAVEPIFLWPSSRRIARLGPLAPLAGPLLRGAARVGASPVHYFALAKRISRG